MFMQSQIKIKYFRDVYKKLKIILLAAGYKEGKKGKQLLV